MRPLALSVLLCACSSLSSDQERSLATYQQNAALYFERGLWNQAMIQIERGLELEPDDYKLSSMKGGILLLASGGAQGTDHRQLDEATALLARLYEERSLSRHEPHLLLNFARAQQKQGLRHLGEALRLEGQAQRTNVGAEQRQLGEQARTQRQLAGERLQQADDLLAELVQRGEMLRLAHNHRLQIALQRGDDAGFERETKAYFALSTEAQRLTKKRIEDTPNLDFEREQSAMLRQLVDEEIQVRSLAAEFYFARRNFTEALVHLDRAVEADPRRFAAYYNRGRVLLELGRLEAAKADFRRFLADPAIPVTSEKAVFALKAIDQ